MRLDEFIGKDAAPIPRARARRHMHKGAAKPLGSRMTFEEVLMMMNSYTDAGVAHAELL